MTHAVATAQLNALALGESSGLNHEDLEATIKKGRNKPFGPAYLC